MNTHSRGLALTLIIMALGCRTDSGGVAGGDASNSKACGALTCATGQACVEYVNGAPPPDGGWPTEHQCIAVPSACIAHPTCVCLDQNGGSSQFCQRAYGGASPCFDSRGPDGMADLFCGGI
jgi:hypothetical protein